MAKMGTHYFPDDIPSDEESFEFHGLSISNLIELSPIVKQITRISHQCEVATAKGRFVKATLLQAASLGISIFFCYPCTG